jgi:murein DD-endopeptidase MepM/ murein hydrolase activator NlpD
MSTARADRLVHAIADAREISVRRAYLDVAGPFPIAGPANWSNDWHALRPCPYPHLHEGLDMFAAKGTPVVAVANGTITVLADPITGLGITLSTRRGMDYLYAHLSAYAPRALTGANVKEGQVIGFVGNTGDASEGAPHLHFQAMPGGIPMPPKPLVDRWLDREIRRAHLLLDSPRHRHTGISVATLPMIERRWPPVAPYRPVDRPVVTEQPRAPTRPISVKATSAVPMTTLGVIVALLLLAMALRWRARRRPEKGRRTTQQEGGLEEAWLAIAAHLRPPSAIGSGPTRRPGPGP